MVDHLALLVAGEDRAVHRTHVAFRPDVGIVDKELNGFRRFRLNRIDAAAAVGVDVGKVELQALHGLNHLAHAFNVGARGRRPRVPGDVDPHFVRNLNHAAAGFERKRPVAAHELDADRTRFDGFFEPRADFPARGRERAEEGVR